MLAKAVVMGSPVRLIVASTQQACVEKSKSKAPHPTVLVWNEDEPASSLLSSVTPFQVHCFPSQQGWIVALAIRPLTGDKLPGIKATGSEAVHSLRVR